MNAEDADNELRSLSSRLKIDAEAWRRAGELLIQRKAEIPHGNWLHYLKSIDIDDSKAQQCMAIFRACREEGLTDLTGQKVRKWQALSKKGKRLEKREKRNIFPFSPPVNEDIATRFHCTDFRNLMDLVPAESADVVVADPPWDSGHVRDFEAIDEVASRMLKPGGSALIYYPRQCLPEVVASFTRLKFALELFCVYSECRPTWSLDGTMIRTRPVLWYFKGPLKEGRKLPDCPALLDTVHPKNGNDKEWHKWAQSSEALANWLGKLTVPGSTVVDCHVGGGSVAAAVQAMGNRSYIGSDIDQSAIDGARLRLAGEKLKRGE